ncbi:MAG: hypothetical protein ACI4ON_04025 [Clostridia bacterium]
MIDYLGVKFYAREENLNVKVTENNYMEIISMLSLDSKARLILEASKEQLEFIFKDQKIDDDLLIKLGKRIDFWTEDFQKIISSFSEDEKNRIYQIVLLENGDVSTSAKFEKIADILFTDTIEGKERFYDFIGDDVVELLNNYPWYSPCIVRHLDDEQIDEVINNSNDDVIYSISERNKSSVDINKLLSKDISLDAKTRLIKVDSVVEEDDSLPYESQYIDFTNLPYEVKTLVINLFDYNNQGRVWFKEDNLTNEDVEMILENEHCVNIMGSSNLKKITNCIQSDDIGKYYSYLVNIIGVKTFFEDTTLWEKATKEQRGRFVNNLSYEEISECFFLDKVMENTRFKEYISENKKREIRSAIDLEIEKYKNNEKYIYVPYEIYELATNEQRENLIQMCSLSVCTKIIKNDKSDFVFEGILNNIDKNILYNEHDAENFFSIYSDLSDEEKSKVVEKLSDNNICNLYRSFNDRCDNLIIEGVQKRIINNPKLAYKHYLLDVVFDLENKEEIKKVLLQNNPSRIIEYTDLEKKLDKLYGDDNKTKDEIIDYVFENINENVYFARSFFINKIKSQEDISKYMDKLDFKQKLELYETIDSKDVSDVILEYLLESDTKEADFDFKIDIIMTNIFNKTDKEISKKIIDKFGFANSINSLKREGYYYINIEEYNEEIKYSIDKYPESINEIDKIDYIIFSELLSDFPNESRKIIDDSNYKYILNSIGEKEYEDLMESIEDNSDNRFFIAKFISDKSYNLESKEKFKKLLKNNKYVIQQLNPRLFGEEFVDYSVDLIERFTKVDGMVENLVYGLSSGKTQKFNMIMKTVLDGNDLEEGLNVIADIYNQMYLSDTDIFEKIDGNLTPKMAENLKELFLRNAALEREYGYDYKEQSKYYINIESMEDIENYDHHLKETSDRLFYGTNSLKLKMDAFSNRFYSMSYDEARKIVSSYGKGIDELSENNPELKNSSEYEFLNSIKDFVSLYENTQIDYDSKINVLNSLYEELQEKNNIEFTREDISILQNKCRGEFSKELNNSMMKVKNQKITRYGEYDVPIIEMKDDFKILVHSLGAYGDFNDSEGYKESWNNNENISNRAICCSLISDQYMGTANIDNVMIGFDSLEKDSLNTESPRDLWTYNNGLVVESRNNPKFFSSKTMINSSRSRYNEINIERKELRNVESKYVNVQPTCVILFDEGSYSDDVSYETIKENAYNCAKSFDVPIVYIDKLQYSERNLKRIDEKIEEFNEKDSINSDELIDITRKYNNYKCGDLARGYHTKKTYDDKIKEIWKQKCQDASKEDIEKLYNYIEEEKENYRTCFTYEHEIPGIDRCSIWNISKEYNFEKSNKKAEDIIKLSKHINFTEDEIKAINYIKKDIKIDEKKQITKEDLDRLDREIAYTILQMDYQGVSEETRVTVYENLRHNGINIAKNGLKEKYVKSENKNERKVILDIFRKTENIEKGELDNLEIQSDFKDVLEIFKDKIDKEYGMKKEILNDNQGRNEKIEKPVL